MYLDCLFVDPNDLQPLFQFRIVAQFLVVVPIFIALLLGN